MRGPAYTPTQKANLSEAEPCVIFQLTKKNLWMRRLRASRWLGSRLSTTPSPVELVPLVGIRATSGYLRRLELGSHLTAARPNMRRGLAFAPSSTSCRSCASATHMMGISMRDPRPALTSSVHLLGTTCRSTDPLKSSSRSSRRCNGSALDRESGTPNQCAARGDKKGGEWPLVRNETTLSGRIQTCGSITATDRGVQNCLTNVRQSCTGGGYGGRAAAGGFRAGLDVALGCQRAWPRSAAHGD